MSSAVRPKILETLPVDMQEWLGIPLDEARKRLEAVEIPSSTLLVVTPNRITPLAFTDRSLADLHAPRHFSTSCGEKLVGLRLAQAEGLCRLAVSLHPYIEDEAVHLRYLNAVQYAQNAVTSCVPDEFNRARLDVLTFVTGPDGFRARAFERPPQGSFLNR